MRIARSFIVVSSVLVLPLAACTQWEAVTVSPRDALEDPVSDEVRIIPRDRPPVMVSRPGIVNDTVVSVASFCSRQIGGSGLESCIQDTTRVMPLADVEAVEVRRSAPEATGGVVLMVVVGVVVLVASELSKVP